MIDKLKSCCIFFLSSEKRTGLLTEIVRSEVLDLGKRKPLIDLYKTRWAERHIAYSHSFKFIVTALEVISLGLHKGKYDELFTACSWDAKSKSDANSFLNGITWYNIIIAFLTAYKFLSHLEGITIKVTKFKY